jgi:hypothetical protein
MGTRQELHLADNDPWLLWASHGTYSVQITVPLVEFIRNRAPNSDIPNPQPPHSGWDKLRAEITIPDDHVLRIDVPEPPEGKSSFDAKVTFSWDTEADCAVYPWCGLDYACIVRNSVAQSEAT